jgi:multiple sugar transport system ATP-binding protein
MVYASTMRGQPRTIALEGQRHIAPGTMVPTYIDPTRYHVFGPDGLALE